MTNPSASPEARYAHLTQTFLKRPGVTCGEGSGFGSGALKIGGKIFAMRHSLHEIDRWSVWFKAPPGVQELVVGNDATRFFVPPYVGSKGWIGAYLDVEQDWDELGDFVEESYRMTAPKRLLTLFETRESGSADTESGSGS